MTITAPPLRCDQCGWQGRDLTLHRTYTHGPVLAPLPPTLPAVGMWATWTEGGPDGTHALILDVYPNEDGETMVLLLMRQPSPLHRRAFPASQFTFTASTRVDRGEAVDAVLSSLLADRRRRSSRVVSDSDRQWLADAVRLAGVGVEG